MFTSLIIGKEVLISVLNRLLKYNKIAVTLYHAHREVTVAKAARCQRVARGHSGSVAQVLALSLITTLIRLALLCRWDSVYYCHLAGCHSWTLKSHYGLLL